MKGGLKNIPERPPGIGGGGEDGGVGGGVPLPGGIRAAFWANRFASIALPTLRVSE